MEKGEKAAEDDLADTEKDDRQLIAWNDPACVAIYLMSRSPGELLENSVRLFSLTLNEMGPLVLNRCWPTALESRRIPGLVRARGVRSDCAFHRNEHRGTQDVPAHQHPAPEAHHER